MREEKEERKILIKKIRHPGGSSGSMKPLNFQSEEDSNT